ncbi:transglutaminase family protein [Rhodopirellula sp. JC639]|uniref:transglutaminase family protein n=1 Tax=Stieleria mannarensis TaxID=2755585 RepID=UPI001601531D|nr:transglutaminase family protein [Rhodopirellula sp. JC639]
MDPDDDVLQALADHDRRVTHAGLSVWVGAEPTYTDRFSETPEWLFDALGDDKYDRALKMLARLGRHHKGAAILRSVGRQYGGESHPRWCVGIYARRDGSRVWSGPPDPAVAAVATTTADDANAAQLPATLCATLSRVLRSIGLSAATVHAPLQDRVVFRTDGTSPPVCDSEEPALARTSFHSERVVGAEPEDELADAGNYLIVCREQDGIATLELPKIPDVKLFERLLDALSNAAIELELPAIILCGYPPPVDSTVSWTTITPDPAVIEANMAPVGGTVDLLQHLRQLENAAKEEGLAPLRLQYNGVESDSGGGGHITLGGARPSVSPFLTTGHLLPGIVRYFNRHPSLSYLHATDSVGPSSQAPRVDESLNHDLSEFALALELLHRVDSPTPETLWSSLAPFLADPSGNSHRAEINIEKLWNPFLGGRGCNGLVEFRAFRMAPSAETTAALAALLRAVVTMLAKHRFEEPLVSWGPDLHARFSLPYFLHRDMKEVLANLRANDLTLGPPLVQRLLRDRDLILAQRTLGSAQLEIRQALEFWPLVGDVATQERGGSRLIDSSTSRVEIRLRSNDPNETLDGWKLVAGDWSIPWHQTADEDGSVALLGLRYRTFVPHRGLHPTLGAQTPLQLTISHPRHGHWRVSLHEWHPESEPYAGLPATVDEARRRREQRCVIQPIEAAPLGATTKPPRDAINDPIVDLRWQQPNGSSSVSP